MIRRIPNWTHALEATYKATKGKTFAWGSHDCTRSVADVIEAITGVDLMGELRGRYHDKKSGVQLIKELGGFDDAVSNVLDPHFERCHPKKAAPGDVFYMNHEGCKTLGFIWFDGKPFVAFEGGWEPILKSSIVTAWRIP